MLIESLGAGVSYAFSDRGGGVSAAPYDGLNLGTHVGDDAASVAANRRDVAGALGLAPERVVFMQQVHGDTVVVVTGPVPGEVAACDALVTAEPGLALAVMVADCVPVLLADTGAGVVAAVHAGRRGVQAGIVGRALEAMTGLGADPARTTALLGPSVCGSCYEVPEEMAAEVLAVAPGARATTPAGTAGLDLRAGLAGVLAGHGLSGVSLVGPCTRETADLFSYRRDPVTGRFAGFVWRDAGA